MNKPTPGEASKTIMDVSQQIMALVPEGYTLIGSLGAECDDGQYATSNILVGRPIVMIESIIGLAEKVENHVKTELAKDATN